MGRRGRVTGEVKVLGCFKKGEDLYVESDDPCRVLDSEGGEGQYPFILKSCYLNFIAFQIPCHICHNGLRHVYHIRLINDVVVVIHRYIVHT